MIVKKGIEIRAHVVTPGQPVRLEDAVLVEFRLAGVDYRDTLEAAIVRCPEAHQNALRKQLREVVESAPGTFDELAMAAVDDVAGYTWLRVFPVEVVS